MERFKVRRAHWAQRGSQSLEWMGVAAFVGAVVCGAFSVATSHGFDAQMANLFMNKLSAPFTATGGR